MGFHSFGGMQRCISHAPSRDELFSSDDFAATFSETIESTWLTTGNRVAPSDRVLSLDVFDTLLLRDNSSELHRFHEMSCEAADRLSAPQTHTAVSGADILSARYLATLASYRASRPVRGCREGSLREIHQTVSLLLFANADASDALIETELDYEARSLRANTLLLDLVARHRQAGGRVILLSDMYMHADQIERLLKSAKIDTAMFDLLLSSADTKVSKASAGIFSIAEHHLSAQPHQFLHIGDSLKGDYQQPRRRGWAAVHMPIARTERQARRLCHARTEQKLAQHHGLRLPKLRMPN